MSEPHAANSTHARLAASALRAEERESQRLADANAQRTKRASNIQWTVAEEYHWTPENEETPRDDAFLLWNARRGAAHRLYDMVAIRAFIAAQARLIPPNELEALFSLPIQKTVDRWLQEQRAALTPLIHTSHRDERRRFSAHPTHELGALLREGSLARAQGEVPKLVPSLRALLDRLESLEGCTTPELLEGMREILQTFFHVRPLTAKTSKVPEAPSAQGKDAPQQSSDADKAFLSDEEVQAQMSVGSAEFTTSVYTDPPRRLRQEAPKKPIQAKAEDARRDIVMRTYGASLLSPYEEEHLTKRTSTGIHREVRPLMTRGILPEAASTYRRELRETVQRDNRRYLDAHAREIHIATTRLEKRLRAAMNQSLEDDAVSADHGRLIASRAWRALKLHDNAIFQTITHDAPGTLIVDVLLDASASQADRSPQIATQGFVLAQALAAAGIPFRVLSYQSQQGFTILTLLKDYDEAPDPDALMRYVPDGANRDGYALRLTAETMRRAPGAKNVLFVLTDGKPFDQRILLNAHAHQHFVQYRDALAINDTAHEVRALRQQDIRVFGLFTGKAEDVAAAQQIYGSAFAYLTGISRFAELVWEALRSEL